MRFIAVASALLALIVLVNGCQTNRGLVDSPPSTAVQPSDHPGKFAVGDVLDLYCYDLVAPGERTDIPARVADDGTIPLPYLGDVKVVGMTAIEIVRVINQAYRDANVEDGPHFYIRRIRTGERRSRIGNFDLVRVALWDMFAPGSETIQIARVEADGRVDVPFLGAIKLAGLTESQAGQALAQAYRKANLVQNLLVSVFILEPAPPNANKLDLPDLAIKPVPAGLEWLYEDRPRAEPTVVAHATTRESSRPPDAEPPLAPTASGASETEEKFQAIFDQAVRAHAAGGVAKYTLPKSSADYVRDHGCDAMGFLEKQLVSDDADIQAAALDFIAGLSDIPSVHQRAHVAKLRLLFHEACMRDNNSGQQAPALPDEDVQCFREDPAAAMRFLKTKLLFARPAIQMTALQFVLKIGDIPAIHDWAMCVMGEAIESGPAARNMVKATYEEWLRKDRDAKR